MEPITAILGIVSLVGTIVGLITNHSNNEFIEKTNEDNQEFQRETNEQNHQWSLEAAEWEYKRNRPQTQYADLLAAGITPAAAAQKVSGANVSYSPATAVAPQNMPKSNNALSDSLQQVIGQIGDYSNMAQAQASADKTKAETKVINETAIKKANAEIDKILADTLKSYSDIDVNNANVDLTNEKVQTEQANQNAIAANIDLTNEKVQTEQANRRSIQLSNEEKQIQLEFTRKTLEMSLMKTEAEIKVLAEQTAKLQGEVNSVDFDNKFKEWRNTYIDTYGVAPEQGWQDMLFKAMTDGKGDVMLDSLSRSLRLIFSPAEYDPSKFDFDYNSLSPESQKFYDEKEKNGQVYHQYYIGPWRMRRFERWRNRNYQGN